jgi:micrococcal nuclease
MLRNRHILAILVIAASLLTVPVFAVEKGVVHGQQDNNPPDWIMNLIEWWEQNLISDDEYHNAIDYLVNEGIILMKPITKNVSQECGSSECFTDYVTRIVDGDTIYTATLKIRLSLTNTPESYEDGFNEATEFTKKLCSVGSEIIIDQDDLQPVDKYGRVLAKLFCGEKVLNSELLYNGHANILTQYCSTSEFSGEEWAQRFGCDSNENQPS